MSNNNIENILHNAKRRTINILCYGYSIAAHYDDGNVLFKAMLGDAMVYTSALWTGPGVDPTTDLQTAQLNKVDRILDLTNGARRVLDIGSGWGYLVNRARQRGMDATGLCNCVNMVRLAQERYASEWFQLLDYRDIPATHAFDAITAVEMIEAVPATHYPDFVAACDRALRPGGRVVMQVIHAMPFNNPVARRRHPTMLGTFVTTHIFPGQQIPKMESLYEAFWKTRRFKKVYMETTSHDYGRTLGAWSRNLEVHQQHFPAEVIRKYQYYLQFCEVGFASELLHLSRIVFEKL